ncbi:hypothetical protein PF002_g23258 [Phytophthora fragariae]|uniref:Uncharacterized protein n=1 Tax=Phytophthora fragariae TaxID=53985 RepID=A0A6A4CIB4_9STRA|nr:hypothetical protein PF002_g23258 [Phytophthora fragariae]KAE9287293.1 hypothetical protein PF001_g21054 [Phytophthora fragariae]
MRPGSAEPSLRVTSTVRRLLLGLLRTCSFPDLPSLAHLRVAINQPPVEATIAMKFFSCLALVVLALTTATVSANAAEEIGVKARHMLAMGDESIMFARGSLRREEETD